MYLLQIITLIVYYFLFKQRFKDKSFFILLKIEYLNMCANILPKNQALLSFVTDTEKKEFYIVLSSTIVLCSNINRVLFEVDFMIIISIYRDTYSSP
jgi:hypothetical protein